VFPPKLLTASLLVVCLVAPAVRGSVSASTAPRGKSTAPRAKHVASGTLTSALSATAWASAGIGTLERGVFELALAAASCAVRSGSVGDLATLTVIDYSRPSTQKRLWVFDLETRALLFEELVAHGRGSGENVPTSFSNVPESHQSSLGLFRTEDTYVGRNGYSLRLAGLDAGFNDQAYDRAIVMHGAPYVSDDFARAQGRLGRSWGCPALREGIAREVIDTVKGRGLVFAYYPDPAWLAASKYLGGCDGPPPASGL
jgi:hypothetical protein